jgi:two-component system, NtrC family, nitrogen regulation sensor histidine kinase NtrY
VKPLLKNIFRGKYMLLLLAALLFALSFFFNKIYTNRSSVQVEVSRAEQYLAEKENDFKNVLADTALVNRVVANRETMEEFTSFTERPYGIFFYALTAFAAPEMKFWGNQSVVPPAELVVAADSGYVRKLPNGWYYIIKKSIETAAGKAAALAVIPVRSQFFITTDYLPEHFSFSKNADKRVRINEKAATPYPVKSAGGATLFR